MAAAAAADIDNLQVTRAVAPSLPPAAAAAAPLPFANQHHRLFHTSSSATTP